MYCGNSENLYQFCVHRGARLWLTANGYKGSQVSASEHN